MSFTVKGRPVQALKIYLKKSGQKATQLCRNDTSAHKPVSLDGFKRRGRATHVVYCTALFTSSEFIRCFNLAAVQVRRSPLKLEPNELVTSSFSFFFVNDISRREPSHNRCPVRSLDATGEPTCFMSYVKHVIRCNNNISEV